MTHQSHAEWRASSDAIPRRHAHEWGEWEPSVFKNVERRYCACGAFEMRPVEVKA